MHFSSIVFPIAAIFASGISATAIPVDGNSTLAARGQGINCEGSSSCFLKGKSAASTLRNYINSIDDNRWFNNNEQIACTGYFPNDKFDDGICAFLANTGGSNGAKIKQLAGYIIEHNCKTCGSVPYFYPGDNDVDHGRLTFNYVAHSCHKNGVC